MTHQTFLTMFAIVGAVVLFSILGRLWRQSKKDAALIKWDAESIAEHNRQVLERNDQLERQLKLLHAQDKDREEAFTRFRAASNENTEALFNLETLLDNVQTVLYSNPTQHAALSFDVEKDHPLRTLANTVKSETFSLSKRLGESRLQAQNLRKAYYDLARENESFMGKVSRAWQPLSSKERPEIGDLINLLSSVDGAPLVNTLRFNGWDDYALKTLPPIYRWSKVYPVPTRLLAKDVEAANSNGKTLEQAMRDAE